MKKVVYYNKLYDIYQNLLTEKQRIYYEEYYFDNLSLHEISENYQVSRNAVYKQLKDVVNKLVYFENQLAFLKKKDMLLSKVDEKNKKIVERIL